jgi:hypothetical protein
LENANMRRHPHYEIIETHCSFFVVRVVDGHSQIIERFDEQSAAEDFIGFLAFIGKPAHRLAS